MTHDEYIHIVPGASTAVLFVHGICSTPRHFDFLVRDVPETCSVINLRLDGHGGTVRDFARTSMARWRAQVSDSVESLCATHDAVILVGYSLGALLVIEEAQRHPQVRGLLLLHPPLYLHLHPRMLYVTPALALGKRKWKDPYAAAMAEDTGMRLSPFLPVYLTWIPRFWELLVLCRRCRPLAARLRLPCYVFLGERDELVRLRTARAFAAVPTLKLHRMKHAGHAYRTEEDRAAIRGALSTLLHGASTRSEP